MNEAKPLKTTGLQGYSILFADDLRKPFVGKQGQAATLLHPDGQRTELAGARVIQQFADQNNLCDEDRRTLDDVPTYYELGPRTFRVRHLQDQTGLHSFLDIDVEGREIDETKQSGRASFLVDAEQHVETIKELLAAGSGTEAYQFLQEREAEQEREREAEHERYVEWAEGRFDEDELELD